MSLGPVSLTFETILAPSGSHWVTLGVTLELEGPLEMKGDDPRDFCTTVGGTLVAAATVKGGPMSLKHSACASSRDVAKNVPKGSSRHSRDPRLKDCHFAGHLLLCRISLKTI